MNNTIPHNWYEQFFSGINCEMWEKAMTPEWTNPEVTFVRDILNLPAGATILDMPCGMGRHSIVLARQGFQVTAIDISAEFLNGLRKKVKVENLSIQVIEADILSVQITDSFDGAFCLGDSFGYFNYPGMEIFGQKVAASLKPGAK